MQDAETVPNGHVTSVSSVFRLYASRYSGSKGCARVTLTGLASSNWVIGVTEVAPEPMDAVTRILSLCLSSAVYLIDHVEASLSNV